MPPGKGSGQFHGHQHPRPPRVLHFFFLEKEKQMRKKPELRAQWKPQEPPPPLALHPLLSLPHPYPNLGLHKGVAWASLGSWMPRREPQGGMEMDVVVANGRGKVHTQLWTNLEEGPPDSFFPLRDVGKSSQRKQYLRWLLKEELVFEMEKVEKGLQDNP